MNRAVLSASALTALLLVPAGPSSANTGFTDTFHLEACTWASRGSQNQYFPLRPGQERVLVGEEDGAEIEVIITTLKETERITFETASGATISVRARVLQERESEDGELVEISRNWFAICKETGDVYYFGEDVDIYEDGEIVSHDGAWRAGVDDARPGIIMPGTFLLGSKYYQEVAPGVALDRARHIEDGITLPTEAGTFTDCVFVKESSPLDAGAFSFKIYCPGVGLTFDDPIELVESEG